MVSFATFNEKPSSFDAASHNGGYDGNAIDDIKKEVEQDLFWYGVTIVIIAIQVICPSMKMLDCCKRKQLG